MSEMEKSEIEKMIEAIKWENVVILKPEDDNNDQFQVRANSNEGFIAGFGKTLEEAILDLLDSAYKSLVVEY